jgi:hypothetical protein
MVSLPPHQETEVNKNESAASPPPATRPRGYALAIPGLAACLLAAGWAPTASANVVTEFNAIGASCLSRPGPGSLMDLALVQVAVHDAIQAIERRYETYRPAPPGSGSKAAAAAAAAYRMLSDNRICAPPAAPAVDPQVALDALFKPYQDANDPGLAVGFAAADRMLLEIRGTTTTIPLPFLGGTGIGQWRPTPPANAPMSFVYLATTTPFTMTSPSQFRPGPAPALTSDRYTRDYNEVKEKGGTLSHPAAAGCPAPADTDMARFWSGNFGVQWNQATRDMAIDRQLGLGDTARLLALANLAGADAAIAVWESKVHYNVWRPITAINLGNDDGNPRTAGDPSWVPFIAGAHFSAGSQTPPYPDYVSGANGLTGAFTTILQLFFKTDNASLEIHKAVPSSVAICTNPRLYRRISDAAEEVVDARILLGIHFRFADTAARTLGTRIAWHAFTNELRPLHPGWHDFGSHDND